MLDEENSSDDGFETNLQFDTVCSICDNGGYILWYVKLHSFKKKVDAIFRAPHQLQLFYFISFFLNSVVKEAAWELSTQP